MVRAKSLRSKELEGNAHNALELYAAIIVIALATG